MTDDGDARARFAHCLTHVLAHEGGYADHPADPGGATNMGITRKTLARWRGISPYWSLPKAEVRGLDRAEAATIYEALFWRRSGGADLPAGLDLALFDFAVNSGPDRAIRTLQGIVGAKADGFVGPITLAAIRRSIGLVGLAGLIKALCDRRLSFLDRLATYATFGRGWNRRVAAIRAAALAMAGDRTSAGGLAPAQPWSEMMTFLSGYKTYIVALAMAIAGLAQVMGVDLPSFEGQSAGHLMMEALAIVFLRQGIKTAVENA
ncbi:Predicted Peptidoglycan domain-containing protein [Devosia enhydra]|uniref:Predicted Peptidoglycan domain-containing protein n=1 Tax=Devosia enhydra TaxID=665118 RepID=A0A1K2I296_9HYPH|nr:glycosyl hydrolase 108 family protein [Devosia enhydra]SFZ85868.1 Predicted Peptidoglycan domain-containing protein [Devosia enhydra]